MFNLCDTCIWYDSNVKKEHNQIGLLGQYSNSLVIDVPVVIFDGFSSVFDKFFSFVDECSYVGEIILVNLIG